MMTKQAIGALILSLSVVGCASELPGTAETGYANLPGVRDTPKGPGLLSTDHYDPANGGGTLLFSTDADKPAVFNTDRASAVGEPGKAASRVGASSPVRPTPDTSPSTAEAESREHRRFRAFQRFEAFRAYRRFQALPADAPQRQRFRRWLEWHRQR